MIMEIAEEDVKDCKTHNEVENALDIAHMRLNKTIFKAFSKGQILAEALKGAVKITLF